MASSIIFIFSPETETMEMRGACTDEELFTLVATGMRVLAERVPLDGRSIELYQEFLKLFEATETEVKLNRLQ